VALHTDLTVVAIYGHNDGSSAIPSIVESVSQLPGSRGLLISLERPPSLPDHIAWKQTAPLDYFQYSMFCMYCLQSYIETEYCLVVQDDGWVINGDNFTDEYYEYDYVGAPTHMGILGDQAMFNFSWVHVKDPIVVQNGGFSLRSRKFLQTLSKHGVVHKLYAQEPFVNEDVQISGLLRPQLESLGIRYAPLHIAKNFSIEYFGRPLLHEDLDLERLVGHHAPIRKLVAHKSIAITCTLQEAQGIFCETDFHSFFKDKGYNLEYRNP
jgi:hypothetical protein